MGDGDGDTEGVTNKESLEPMSLSLWGLASALFGVVGEDRALIKTVSSLDAFAGKGSSANVGNASVTKQ